ncbi:MAG: GFA family protein [Candidatus Binataceae bacterium]
MADFKLTGGCFCGGVRYSITAPAVDNHHCHCGIRRKFHGAIFVTLSAFPSNAFKYDGGTANLGTCQSSDKVRRRRTHRNKARYQPESYL